MSKIKFTLIIFSLLCTSGTNLKFKRQVLINEISNNWNYINFSPYMKNNKMLGWKIISIDKKSLFYNLGVRSDFILIKICDQNIQGENENIFQCFSNLNNLNNIDFTFEYNEKISHFNLQIID